MSKSLNHGGCFRKPSLACDQLQDQRIHSIVGQLQFRERVTGGKGIMGDARIAFELSPLGCNLILRRGSSGIRDARSVFKAKRQSLGQLHRINQVADADRHQSLHVEIHVRHATFKLRAKPSKCGLDRRQHKPPLSAAWNGFRQADVIELASGSTINGSALISLVFE